MPFISLGISQILAAKKVIDSVPKSTDFSDLVKNSRGCLRS